MNTRIQKLHEWCRVHGLDGVVVDAPVDLYYLTQLEVSAGLFVLINGEATLHVDGRYIAMAKEKAPCCVELLGKTLPHLRGKLGFDSATMTYAKYSDLNNGAELVPHPRLMQEVRRLKDSQETVALREAAQLNMRGYAYLVDQLRVGITERELARQLEIFWLQNGGERLSFEPIIAFGAHAALPHHRPSEKPLEKGQVVLFDVGVQKGHYQSDATRVVFFGEPPEPMRQVYSIVHRAYTQAVAIVKPGTTLGDLDSAARQTIAEAGYADAFPHALGHGVGLAVHEYPLIRQAAPWKQLSLEEGMVITIEPGIYLPSVGGVRLEDTFLVTKESCESLTTPTVANNPRCILVE